MQQRFTALFLVLVLAMLGCGRRDGLTRFRISGEITYSGKPVGGMVRFVPDSDKGNRGPATMVQAVAGQYRSADGYGVLGGPYNVEISGYEPLTPEQEKAGVSPKPLFEGYKVSVDLPKKDSVMDFDIPRK